MRRRAPALVMDREGAMDDALGMRAGPLPPGVNVLVEDELAAGGGFVLAHLLQRALGGVGHRGGSSEGGGGAGPHTRVCLVCAEQDFAHHARVMGKLGRNLRADVASGALVVVDALTAPFAWCAGRDGDSKREGVETHTRDGDARGLDGARDMFRAIARALGDTRGDTRDAVCVVFDSLNAIAECEASDEDANRAIGSLLASVSSLNGGAEDTVAVVALAHGDACGERARWLDDTRRRADVIVRCRGLTTGRAADVHGVVSVEHRTGVLARSTIDVQSTTRRIDARFQLTELGPRVTRVHTA